MIKKARSLSFAVALLCQSLAVGGLSVGGGGESHRQRKSEVEKVRFRPLVGLKNIVTVRGDRFQLESGVAISLYGIGKGSSTGPFWTPDGLKLVPDTPTCPLPIDRDHGRVVLLRVNGSPGKTRPSELGLILASGGPGYLNVSDTWHFYHDYPSGWALGQVPYCSTDDRILIGVPGPIEILKIEKIEPELQGEDYLTLSLGAKTLTLCSYGKSFPREREPFKDFQEIRLPETIGPGANDLFRVEFLDREGKVQAEDDLQLAGVNSATFSASQAKSVRITRRRVTWYQFLGVKFEPKEGLVLPVTKG